MLDNNLLFSLVLSIINTGIFFALTHKENFDQKKQEYIMLFGITFVTSFKGWSNDETIYTLQKQNLIVSCKVRNFKYETCRAPVNEN